MNYKTKYFQATWTISDSKAFSNHICTVLKDLQHDCPSPITMMTQEEKSILSFDGYSLGHVKRCIFTRAHSQGSSGSALSGGLVQWKCFRRWQVFTRVQASSEHMNYTSSKGRQSYKKSKGKRHKYVEKSLNTTLTILWFCFAFPNFFAFILHNSKTSCLENFLSQKNRSI